MIAVVVTVVTTAVILLSMGREPICKCGTVKLWHGVVQSAETSQHITDWYTPSHVIHGFAFYGLLWPAARRWPVGARMVAATVIEGGWENLENTDLIINRYREATISLDYYGDSVLNSVRDIGAMLLGFLLASRLPVDDGKRVDRQPHERCCLHDWTPTAAACPTCPGAPSGT